MTIEDLEEELAEILLGDFKIKKVKGKFVIYTNLVLDEFNEIVEAEKEAEDDDDDSCDEAELDLIES